MFVCINLYAYCRSLSQPPLPPSLAGRIYKDLLQLRTNMVRAKQRPPYFSTILLGDGGLAFSGVEGGGVSLGGWGGPDPPPRESKSRRVGGVTAIRRCSGWGAVCAWIQYTILYARPTDKCRNILFRLRPPDASAPVLHPHWFPLT